MNDACFMSDHEGKDDYNNFIITFVKSLFKVE